MSGAHEIWVAGFPSNYGGADTELDHLIDLWRAFGVEVHLVPMFGAEDAMVESVRARGCHVHVYRDDIFADRIVASFCNGEFLEHLPAIAAAGRPRCVLWFNCMTWLFEAEKAAHRLGLIDVFGFVSEYQKGMLLPLLSEIAPVRTFDYRPHFDVARVQWKYREWDGCYKLGRISRDDGAKFAQDMWRIFDRVLVPAPLQKKVYVLGFGPNAHERTGSAPPGLDWRTWSPNEIPACDFYRTIDTMIHKTGGSRESYGRVLVEAYAHGVVPIVERDYAFPQLVVHGETGFLSSDSDEMSYYASWLAMNPDAHRRIAQNGRAHLEHVLSDPEACWRGWAAIFDAYGSGRARGEASMAVPLRVGTVNSSETRVGTAVDSNSAHMGATNAASPSGELARDVGDSRDLRTSPDVRGSGPPRRPRVLAFTCSRDRPMLLRNCILQVGSQSYPADHAVYLNGQEDTRALYADLERAGLFMRFGPSLSQHENYAHALSAVDLDAYDLFCKIDDDDLYRLDYIESVVASFEAYGWDYSGTHSQGMLQGTHWFPEVHLPSLGLLPEDHAAGVIEVMPATTAFSRRAIRHVLTLNCRGYEDIEWRRALARPPFSQTVRAASGFVYHVHGKNLSTGHWLTSEQDRAA